jgi:hypothetical protein
MPSSKSPSPSSTHKRGAHGGGGFHDDEDGGGGGGGGDGPLVKVAFARHQAEAEMMQGLLLEAGIPSVLNRIPGFHSVSYAPGPTDVMVTASAAQRARAVLADTMVESEADELTEIEEQRRLARGETRGTSPERLALWLGAAFLGALILVWVLYQLS